MSLNRTNVLYNSTMKRTRKTQKVRKQINRSGKNPCQICGEPHILQTHHIDGRDIPNANHSSNLADLCPTCHNNVHWGEVIIERWVMTSSGMELIWHKKGEESLTGDNSSPHLIKADSWRLLYLAHPDRVGIWQDQATVTFLGGCRIFGLAVSTRPQAVLSA